MKVPISARLKCVANLIETGCRVADIGCDHGFLGIDLLESGKASFVVASDLREKPLAVAQKNAERFGTAQKMRFVCADGLKGVLPDEVDTIVCAGLGGDAITMILDDAPWVCSGAYTLVLQPQSGVPDLRAYLGVHGLRIDREVPVEDHGFLYSAMRIRFDGVRREISAGERFISAAMLCEPSPLVRRYWLRMVNSVKNTLQSLENTEPLPEKQKYFTEALDQLLAMEGKLP